MCVLSIKVPIQKKSGNLFDDLRVYVKQVLLKMMQHSLLFFILFFYDLDMYPATTGDSGREFNSLRELRIHKVRWCKWRNSPTGECKSNDGLMNEEYPHSVQEPIAERQRPGDIPCKPRILSPKGNQVATWTNFLFFSPPLLRVPLITKWYLSAELYMTFVWSSLVQ